MAPDMENGSRLGINSVQKVTILVRVYNNPDSTIMRIVKRKRRGDKLLRQICNMIAASSLELAS